MLLDVAPTNARSWPLSAYRQYQTQRNLTSPNDAEAAALVVAWRQAELDP